ncbi:MAG: TonB-dependent receptor, partial [Alphaproteobacteria bacterium PA3]
DVEAMINLPLSDTAALRLAGKAIIQDEGFYFNEATGRDIGRREVFLGRAQLLLEPTDTIKALFKAEIQRGRSEIGQPEFFGLAPPVPAEPGLVCPGSPRCTDFFGFRDVDGDPFRGSWSVDPTYDVNQLNLTARISADLGFAELTSVTGYINFDRVWGIDVDATPLRQTDFVTADDVEQFSQELRLAGETDAVNWLGGGFYSWDRVQSTYDGDLRDLFNTTTFTFSDQETETAAAFVNGEWRLTDNLDLITGARYTWERRSNVGGTRDLVSQAPGSALTGAPFGTPPIPLAVVNDTISDRNWSYKLGLNWSIDADTLAYASVSQGVKSGGFFAGVATNSGQLIPYEPERLVSYEAGFKGRLDALDAVYAVSAFYYDYNNVQTFIRDTVGNLPIQRLGNVDKAEIYGIDGELTFRPSFLPGLDWAVGVGLLESELGAFTSSGGAVPAGNRLPDAPTFSFNTLVGYEFDLSSDFAMRFAVDGRYQGLTFKDGLNDPLIAADAFWVWNGRISLMRP